MSSELSATMRDYLAEIYRLSQNIHDDDFVSTSTLAELLDVSAPAVNRMVTKLKEMGLLDHAPYQGITLTEQGKIEALRTVRKHRIVESFLVNVMGFGWHEVFDEAHRMSNALSEPIVDRMLEMAGNPTHSPHGELIPNPDGSMPEPQDVPLSEAEAQKDYRITRVLTRESDRLEYIEALGLVPGVEITLIHAAPFHGPMQLKLHDEFRIIGHNLAELIRVIAI